MGNLLECEGHHQPLHDAFCGLLCCQGVFPNKPLGENEICFTHIVEECQMMQNMNHMCDQAERNCICGKISYMIYDRMRLIFMCISTRMYPYDF